MTEPLKKTGFSDDDGDKYSQFRTLFDQYYRPLTVFAKDYVHDLDMARDIVQSVFVKLWESHGHINIRRSAKSYLYQCVKNACYNHLHAKQHKKTIEFTAGMVVLEDDVVEQMIVVETSERIFEAVEALPKKCRVIFKLSRIRQLRHSEIARKLNITEKTVENQIAIALKKLADYRITLVWLAVFFISISLASQAL